MKPPFGTLNATVAKTIVKNLPRYSRIVEPFGDSGTIALDPRKRKPREHTLNIEDETLFAAFTFVQRATGADLRRLKGFDWIASAETFEKVMAITATEGAEAFYRFYYTKKFGMSMTPDAPPEFDILSTGTDLTQALYALPLMRVGLKGVTITNEEPLSVLGSAGGSDTFLILLPKGEQVEPVRSRLSGLGGQFFFAAKVLSAEEVVSAAGQYRDLQVSAFPAPSVMLSTMLAVTNYANKLVPLDPEGVPMTEMNGQSGAVVGKRRAQRSTPEPGAANRLRIVAQYHDLFLDTAGRIVRREVQDVGREAERQLLRRDAPGFERFLAEYYAKYPNTIERIWRPVLRTYAQAIYADAAAEVGASLLLTVEDEEYIRLLGEKFANAYSGRSLVQMQNVLRDAVLSGDDPLAAIKQRLDEWAEARPEKVAQRETRWANNAVVHQTYKKAGIRRIVWATFGISCPFCTKINGKIVEIDQVFLAAGDVITNDDNPSATPFMVKRRFRYPPLHANCLPGYVAVSAEGITATSKRWYDGNLVIIHTTRGHQLACTPSHPILTPSGWLAAHLLNVGDHVISHPAREWEILIHQNGQDVPTRIEQIAETFVNDPQMLTVPVPVAAEDFHGDGAGSQIAVIGANRLLVNSLDAALQQQRGQYPLILRDAKSSLLAGSGAKTALLERLDSAGGGAVGGSRLALSLLRRHSPCPHHAGLAPIAGLDAGFQKPAANSRAVNAGFSGDRILGLPFGVSPDEIVNIEFQTFHGYVYNLQTVKGLFAAGGILTHNCDCGIRPAN